MNIFIDTNIYLDYYRMSKETLTSLKALASYLASHSNAKLLLPGQIEDEFFRQRNAIIGQSLRVIEGDIKNAIKLPKNLYKDESVRKSTDKINNSLRRHYQGVKRDLLNKNSEINKIIDSLFNIAIKINDDDNVAFNKAFKRMIRGNPPGKNRSIGDAISWEIILHGYTKDTLYIISRDGDWFDESNDTKLKLFLDREWNKKSKKRVYLYKSLAEFLDKGKKAKISKNVIKEEKKAYTPSPAMLNINNENLSLYTAKIDKPFWQAIPDYTVIPSLGMTQSSLVATYKPMQYSESMVPFFSAVSNNTEKKCTKCGKVYNTGFLSMDNGLCGSCCL